MEIVPYEYNGQKVLTINQITAICESVVRRVQDTFSNHKKDFIEGVDYFKLKGAEITRFKAENNSRTLRENREYKYPLLTECNSCTLRENREYKYPLLTECNSEVSNTKYVYNKNGNPIDINEISAKILLLIFTQSGAEKLTRLIRTNKARLIFAAFHYGMFQKEETKNIEPVSKRNEDFQGEKIQTLKFLIEQATDDNLRNKLIRETAQLILGKEI
jgi:hypothetical protein